MRNKSMFSLELINNWIIQVAFLLELYTTEIEGTELGLQVEQGRLGLLRVLILNHAILGTNMWFISYLDSREFFTGGISFTLLPGTFIVADAIYLNHSNTIQKISGIRIHSRGSTITSIWIFIVLPILIYEDVVIEIYRIILAVLAFIVLFFIFVFGYLLPLILACLAAPKSVTWKQYPGYLLRTWFKATWTFFVQVFKFTRVLAGAIVQITAYSITFVMIFIITACIVLVFTACVGGVVEIIWYILEQIGMYFWGPFPLETITHKLCWFIVHHKYSFCVDLFALQDGVWPYVKFAVLPAYGYIPYFPWFIKLWIGVTFVLTPVLLYQSKAYQGAVTVIQAVFLNIARFVNALIFIDRKIKTVIQECKIWVREWKDRRGGPKLLTK